MSPRQATAGVALSLYYLRLLAEYCLASKLDDAGMLFILQSSNEGLVLLSMSSVRSLLLQAALPG